MSIIVDTNPHGLRYDMSGNINREDKFKVGDRAYKPKGYQYPCTIVSVFTNTSGETRIVGEMDFTKMLHIFNEDQLEQMTPEIEADVYSKFRHHFSEDVDYHMVTSHDEPVLPPRRLVKDGELPKEKE